MKFLAALLNAIITLTFVLQGNSQSIPDMLEKSLTGVVTVAVYKTQAANQVYGFRGEVSIPEKAYQKALELGGYEGVGSGFLYEYKGKRYAITNAHVIDLASQEDSSVFVYTFDRTKHLVKVIGADSFYDIAVLEFAKAPAQEYSALKFKPEQSRIGEPVYAIGNPLGELPYSVSDGIISAKNRIRSSFTGKFGYLQSTATLIWGNSGGPLVDVKGQVAGINSQIEIAYTGDIQPQINYALEAGLSERLVKELIDNNGRVIRCYLGLELAQLDTVDQYNPKKEVILSNVIEGSPTYLALKPQVGSIVTHINNEKLESLEQALGILEQKKPGTSLEFTFLRNAKAIKVKVAAGELKTTELESIATHVLTQSEFFEFDPNSSQVMLTYEPSMMFEFGEDRKAKKIQKTKRETYQVLAAGIMGDDGDASDMYKVITLYELGGAIRLSSLSGMLDLSVTKKDDPLEKVKTYRYYFSGDENVTKAILYY